MQLRPYQIEGFNHLCDVLRRHPSAINASSTGVGKTVVSIFVAKALGLTPAVICPKSVVWQWVETLAECGVEPWFVTNYEQVKLGRTGFGDWEIKNKRFKWQFPPKSLLIFDEVHACRKPKTQNAKLLLAARRAAPQLKTLCLSATPAESPLDLFAIGHLLDLHHGDSDFYHWLRANHVVRGKWGLIYKGGVEGMARIHSQLFPARGYRAVAADLPGFPTNQLSTLAVQAGSDRDRKAVQDYLEELCEKRANDCPLPVVDLLRARQQLELLKVAGLADLADNDVQSGNSVVIFVNFTDTLNALVEQLGEGRCSIIQGGQSEEERRTQQQLFQSNKNKIAICQIKAGGQGIDLHDILGRPRISYICPSDSATATIQALGRIHRSGALSPATQFFVFAANTVEEQVRARVKAKINSVAALTDGDLDFTMP
jgi:superfamily II DNA or RNA helicase